MQNASVTLCLCRPEWNTVSMEEQKRLERVSREDGEFWYGWWCFASTLTFMYSRKKATKTSIWTSGGGDFRE